MGSSSHVDVLFISSTIYLGKEYIVIFENDLLISLNLHRLSRDEIY